MTPQVLAALIDLKCDENYIKHILYNIRGGCPIEPLIEEFQKRNKIRVLEGWLDSLVAEGNQIPAVHNTLAEIKTSYSQSLIQQFENDIDDYVDKKIEWLQNKFKQLRQRLVGEQIQNPEVSQLSQVKDSQKRINQKFQNFCNQIEKESQEMVNQVYSQLQNLQQEKIQLENQLEQIRKESSGHLLQEQQKLLQQGLKLQQQEVQLQQQEEQLQQQAVKLYQQEEQLQYQQVQLQQQSEQSQQQQQQLEQKDLKLQQQLEQLQQQTEKLQEQKTELENSFQLQLQNQQELILERDKKASDLESNLKTMNEQFIQLNYKLAIMERESNQKINQKDQELNQLQFIKEQKIELGSQLENIRTSINKLFADSFIMLELKDNMIKEELKAGGQAYIYSIQPTPSSQNIILKVFISDDEDLQQEFKNLMIAKLASCSHVVQLLGIAFIKQMGKIKVGILLQQAKENLSSRLQNHLNIQEKLKLARDIITGLCQLHELQIAHLDLKPLNILILDDGKAVLTDLGISKQLPKTHKTRNADRTPDYCAPEQYSINNQRQIELRVLCDLWSFGCVLLAIFGEIQPWSWLPEKKIDIDRFQIAIIEQFRQQKNPLDHIQDDDQRDRVHAKIPNELQILMRDLFNHDPKQRPTANQTKVRLEQLNYI